ncbi:MAG: RNA polymerase sigma factor RpoD/SigA [Bacilli bacterium]
MDISYIVKEIKSTDNFDLNTYYAMIKKYGKRLCKDAFDEILQNSNNRDNTFNDFFDAYFSFEIDDMEINNDSYLLLAQKYGEDTVSDYFKRLMEVNGINHALIKEKFEDIYQYVDIDNERFCINDDFYSNDSIKMYMSEIGKFKPFSVSEEKKQFNILNEAKKNIDIANIDDNGSLSFNNITNIIYSISCVEQIKLLNRIRKYLNGKDKEIIDKYIKLWKKVNKGSKERNSLPNIDTIENNSLNNNTIDSDYLIKQLEYILIYNETRELIINSNLRLAIYNAKKYFNKTNNLSPLDLIQAGNLGLIRAIEKFDISKGYKFSTYATWWINQSIIRDLAENSRNIRIPVNLQEKIRQMEKAKSQEEREMYKPHTLDEFNIEYVKGLIHGTSFTSLNSPMGDDNNCTIQDAIPSSDKLLDEVIFDIERDNKVREALDTLTDKEKFVIIHRFGFYGNDILTLESIAKKLGVTRERIRQIEAKAIRRLKSPCTKNNLIDFCQKPNSNHNTTDLNSIRAGKTKTKKV